MKPVGLFGPGETPIKFEAFHPFIGAVLIPGMALTALFLLPFYDGELRSVGVCFRFIRGRYLTIISEGFSLLITPLWVLLDETR